jgi:hypothetical protein
LKPNIRIHKFHIASEHPTNFQPCHVQCVKITPIGLLVGQPKRTHDRGRSSKKAIRLDLGEITNFSKTPNIANFQHDGHGQNIADTRNCQ